MNKRRNTGFFKIPRLTIGMVMALIAIPLVLHAQDEEMTGVVVGRTIWETIQRGGEVMYVILLASVLGLAAILDVAFRTRQAAILPKNIRKDLQERGEPLRIGEIIGGNERVSIVKILKAGHIWHKGSNEQIQYAVEKAVDEIVWQLKRVARPIGIIANTTPLLGLLGTVIGIIQAFDVVARQGALGDPGALAGGISKALLTTCFGLIVAIPLLLAYHFFIGKIETQLRKCEELAKESLILPPE